VPDYGTPVYSSTGGVILPDVMANDLLYGLPVNPADVTLTFISTTSFDVHLVGSSVVADPGALPGNFQLVYMLCEVANPGNCDTAIVYFLIDQDPHFCVAPKVLLQGAWEASTGLMRDSLRIYGFIPVTEPYSSAEFANRFAHVGGGGGEIITNAAAVFGVTGNDAIVDWVFVELRDRNDSSVVVMTRSALLQRDGDVVDVDGVSPLCFTNLADTLFYVAVRHRNHLGVMTAAPKYVNFGLTTNVDFTTGAEPEFDFGTTLGYGYDYTGMAQAQLTLGKRGLWAGNAIIDNQVKNQGTDNDRSGILAQVLGHVNNTLMEYNFDLGYGYFTGDLDLNGKVKYQGTGNDRTLLLNFILSYPLNTLQEYNFDFFLEQLP